jgi:hypothetical protein
MRSGRSWILAVVCAVAAIALAPPACAATGEKAPSGFSLPSFGSKDGESTLRRFEIISLGAFPIMLFYSDFSFDLVRFLASGFNGQYAPWPFKSSSSFSPEEGERLARIGVALGASIGVGIADALIRARSLAKEAAAVRAAESASDVPPPNGLGSPEPPPSGNSGP